VDKKTLCVHTAMGLYEHRLIQPRGE
jgi:hypothetical protein